MSKGGREGGIEGGGGREGRREGGREGGREGEGGEREWKEGRKESGGRYVSQLASSDFDLMMSLGTMCFGGRLFARERVGWGRWVG